MGRVHTLPEAVINHIAAGEVIERPASVVKELIENALDAQARSIKVIVQGGGVALIQVDDDGIGMDATDAVQCFQRHATSKIASLEELDSIKTLGFRGEALPSIATVSRFQLTTRSAQDLVGTRVTLAGGVISKVEAYGAPPGTSIQIRDLFFNTPARLKFLKHPTTEASHIAQCFLGLALAVQHVHMTLYLNDRLHTQAPVVSTLGDRLEALFGRNFQDNLLPVEHAEEAFQVYGLSAKATFHRATRRQQFFFVNGRLIQNRALSHALYEAYRTLLPRDRHPVACLFLTVPPGDVDVNVHPAKLEVRFRQEAHLYDRLRRVLRQCLQASLSSAVVVPMATPPASTPDVREPYQAVPMMWRPPAPLRTPEAARSQHFEMVGTSTPVKDLGLYSGYPEAGRDILTGTPLAQLHNTYILMQYTEGMFIIDQHAAHERIVYEQLRARLAAGAPEVQQLLFPATLDLSAADPAWVEACLPRLANLGFVLEPFGGSTYRLPSVPALLQARDYAAVLMDVLEVLRAPSTEDVFEEGVPRVFHRLLTVMACHSAIRAGQRLQQEESRALVQDLARVAMPFTCPHGRPVLLNISMAEIEKKFLRC